MASPFCLSQVELLDGPFCQAQTLTNEYLLSLDPDRLLAGFYSNSGVESSAAIYGGWEAMGLAGHSVGHYLTAASQAFVRTKDSRFREKVEAVVLGLCRCQEARGDGFLSAFRFPDGFDRQKLEDTWRDISEGQLKTGGFDLNGMWAPWYVHHKILVGLLDAYRLCGLDQGLDAARRFADWAIEVTKKLSDDQWQSMLNCEYGGMNEVLADLFSVTSDTRFLQLARRFYDHKVLDPLKISRDELAAKHANTQIPKVLGLARLYDLEGEQEDKTASEFFWHRVANHHTYVIGGNSNGEYFGPADQISSRLSSNTCETCNTYNMLKLTRQLFCWHPSANLADYYERAYLNHILASQHPHKGGYTYFVPLASGSHRTFSHPEDDFTCCHGTGMETHTRHGDSIFFHHGSEALWVNLFLPSRLVWHDAQIVLKQSTSQPFGGEVRIEIEEGQAEFNLLVRHPYWLAEPLTVSVNGVPFCTTDIPSTYVSINRKWQKGDLVEFALPFSLHEQAAPDNAKKTALMYGPLVLAADLGPINNPAPISPVLIHQELPISAWILPSRQGFGSFFLAESARPESLTLRPFFDHPDNRTAVYFDKFSPAEWAAKEEDYRLAEEKEKMLKARTVDQCTLGEMQPERDHDLICERNDVREVNGRGIRTPLTKGWVEINLKVDSSVENLLVLNVWGNDRLDPKFAIMLDGVQIAVHDLAERPLNEFFNLEVKVPINLTNGKNEVRLRIEALDEQPGPTLGAAAMVRG